MATDHSTPDESHDAAPDPDKQAFIEDHMARAKAEEDFWKTASTQDLLARMEGIQAQSRQRDAEWAWETAQRQRQEAQPTGNPSPVLPVESYRTTLNDLKDMLGRDSYPTWFQAAYADLAMRLIRVESQLEDQATTLSLLHGKVEDILAYLLGRESDGKAQEDA
jgi:hypothetical protein